MQSDQPSSVATFEAVTGMAKIKHDRALEEIKAKMEPTIVRKFSWGTQVSVESCGELIFNELLQAEFVSDGKQKGDQPPRAPFKANFVLPLPFAGETGDADYSHDHEMRLHKNLIKKIVKYIEIHREELEKELEIDLKGYSHKDFFHIGTQLAARTWNGARDFVKEEKETDKEFTLADGSPGKWEVRPMPVNVKGRKIDLGYHFLNAEDLISQPTIQVTPDPGHSTPSPRTREKVQIGFQGATTPAARPDTSAAPAGPAAPAA